MNGISEIEAIAALKRLPFFVIGRSAIGTNIITFHAELDYAEIECRWRLATGETEVRVESLDGVVSNIQSAAAIETAPINEVVAHRKPMPAPKVVLLKCLPRKKKSRKYAKSKKVAAD